MIIISTSLYQPPEVKAGELLIKPYSRTHVFFINVGNAPPTEEMLRPLQFAATTAHLATLDFESLEELVLPLCESAKSFYGMSLFAVVS